MERNFYRKRHAIKFEMKQRVRWSRRKTDKSTGREINKTKKEKQREVPRIDGFVRLSEGIFKDSVDGKLADWDN